MIILCWCERNPMQAGRVNSRPTLNPICFWLLLRPVDLRPLQAVRVIHVNRLPLRVEIDRAYAAFTMAVTGSLHATERQVHFGADGGCVDVSDTGFQVAHGAKRLVDVARV